jgi:hypothetical protein
MTMQVSQEEKPVKILVEVVPSIESVKPRSVQGERGVSTERVSTTYLNTQEKTRKNET